MTDPGSSESGAPVVHGSILGDLRPLVDAAVLFSAILYLTGWSYLYGYYKSFGIGMNEVAQTSQPILLFGILSLHNLYPWAVLVVATACFAIIRLVRERVPFPAWMAYLFLTLCSAYWLSNAAVSVGAGVARRHAGSESPLLNVKIIPVGDVPSSSGALSPDCAAILSGTNPARSYRLLFRPPGRIYILLPAKVPGANVTGNVVVCEFEENQIRSTEIQAGF